MMMSPPYPIVVWAFTGETSTRVECWITPTDEPLCRVTVTYGGEMVLHECYADEETARMRADTVRQNLLARGWKPLPHPGSTR